MKENKKNENNNLNNKEKSTSKFEENKEERYFLKIYFNSFLLQIIMKLTPQFVMSKSLSSFKVSLKLSCLSQSFAGLSFFYLFFSKKFLNVENFLLKLFLFNFFQLLFSIDKIDFVQNLLTENENYGFWIFLIIYVFYFSFLIDLWTSYQIYLQKCNKILLKNNKSFLNNNRISERVANLVTLLFFRFSELYVRKENGFLFFTFIGLLLSAIFYLNFYKIDERNISTKLDSKSNINNLDDNFNNKKKKEKTKIYLLFFTFFIICSFQNLANFHLKSIYDLISKEMFARVKIFVCFFEIIFSFLLKLFLERKNFYKITFISSLFLQIISSLLMMNVNFVNLILFELLFRICCVISALCFSQLIKGYIYLEFYRGIIMFCLSYLFDGILGFVIYYDLSVNSHTLETVAALFKWMGIFDGLGFIVGLFYLFI